MLNLCQISIFVKNLSNFSDNKSRLNHPIVSSYPPYHQCSLYQYVLQINVTQEPLLIGWKSVLKQTRVKPYRRVEPTAGRQHLHNSKTETQTNKVKNTRDCKQGTAWTQLSLYKTWPLDKDNISQTATEESSRQKEMSECYTVLWYGPCLQCFWLIVQSTGALRPVVDYSWVCFFVRNTSDSQCASNHL